ncbi:MAG: hypothetical protein JWP87_4183 [Labilithrix sp.]|nr:hypothetical protein [Labilithrix sp.]
MPRHLLPPSFAARLGVALLVVLAATGSTACKKERVVATRFVPLGRPGCQIDKLPEGAVISSAGFSGAGNRFRRLVVYPDGRIVSTRLVFNFDDDRPPRRVEVDDPPASISPARVKAFEADLEATGLFALEQGCWTAVNPGSDGGGRQTVVRHGASSSWAFAVGAWEDVPPAATKAASIEAAFYAEATGAVDRDAAAPAGATDAGSP